MRGALIKRVPESSAPGSQGVSFTGSQAPPAVLWAPRLLSRAGSARTPRFELVPIPAPSAALAVKALTPDRPNFPGSQLRPPIPVPHHPSRHPRPKRCHIAPHRLKWTAAKEQGRRTGGGTCVSETTQTGVVTGALANVIFACSAAVIDCCVVASSPLLACSQLTYHQHTPRHKLQIQKAPRKRRNDKNPVWSAPTTKPDSSHSTKSGSSQDSPRS